MAARDLSIQRLDEFAADDLRFVQHLRHAQHASCRNTFGVEQRFPFGRGFGGKRDLERFFDVADPIYAGDPNWVPPLRSDVAKVFQDENPFFRHGEMQLFVARRGGRDVGRVAAIVERADGTLATRPLE